jgi:hypothetical protein
MLLLKSLFDATFVHMAVGFTSMIIAAFLIVGVAGVVGQSQSHAHGSVPLQANVRE